MNLTISQSNIRSLQDLNEERRAVLRDIRRIPSLPDLEGSEAAKFDQLKHRYNQIMDHIDEFNRSPLQDPLGALPVELWQDIIYCVLENVVGLKWNVDQLLLLTSVSRDWQQAITSTPGFWNRIQVYDTVDDFEAKLATCLHLSKDVALNFFLRVPMSVWTWDAISPHIAGCGGRIRSFTLSNHNYIGRDYDSITLSLTNFIELTGKLSALETFTVYGGMPTKQSLDFVLKDATRIRKVGGVPISSETVRLASMEGLKSITVDDCHSEVLPHLRDLQYLEDVSFNCFHASERVNRSKIGEDTSNSWLTQRPWEWKTLKMMHYPGKEGWMLWNVLSYTLQSLSVSIPWDLLPKFLTASSHMPKLRHLNISLPLSTNVGLPPFSLEVFRCNVTNLVISVTSTDFQANDDAAIVACQDPTRHLAEALLTWAPDVKSLILNTPILSFFVPYIQSLQSLTDFSTSSSQRISETFSEVELTHLEDIRITGSNSILSSFTFPNISQLCISEFIEYTALSRSRVFDPLNLCPNKWSNLRVLEVGIDDILWDDISLPNVKRLTAGSSSFTLDLPHITSSLLKELACNSSSFPALEHLRLRRFPEWDILFIMLQRRNLLSSNEAVPITTLGLPSLPTPFILQPLIEYLRGRLTERPSNFEISLQSMAGVYFSDLPGCDYCHRSFVACDRSPGLYRKCGQHGLVPIEYDVPFYPLSTNEVLATCLDRGEWWSDTLQRLGGRCFPCRRHETYDILDITGDMAHCFESLAQLRSAYTFYHDVTVSERKVGKE